MTPLESLWEASLLLCAVSLLAVAALLLARVIGEGRVARREAMRRLLIPALLKGGTIETMNRGLASKVAATLTIELAELVRGRDREAFVNAAEATGAADELARRLSSRTAQDRLIAAEALAMFPSRRDAVARIALGDHNPDVRLGAALALASEGRAPPIGELVRTLQIGTEENSLLVISLMREFVRTDPHAVEALLYDLDIPDAAKLAATDALAESGAVDHTPLISWMAEASGEDTDLRPRILRALGRIGHPGGHDAILAGLDSTAWFVRASAAEAAGRSRLAAAVHRLGELLEDDQWWVRFRAGQALARLGSIGRLKLQEAAAGPKPVSRHAAKITLAEHGQR